MRTEQLMLMPAGELPEKALHRPESACAPLCDSGHKMETSLQLSFEEMQQDSLLIRLRACRIFI
jgi:hypothetical protein